MKLREVGSIVLEYSVYLWVFLIPWQTRKIVEQGYIAGGTWEYGTYSIYAVDILAWFIFFIAAIYGVGQSSKTKMKKYVKAHADSKLPMVAILLCSIFVIRHFITSGVESVAFTAGWSYLAIMMLMIWIVYSHTVSVKKISIALLGAAIIQAVFAFVQIIYQKQAPSTVLGLSSIDPGELGTAVIEYMAYVPQFGKELGHRVLRAYGSFPHPNILGGFMMTASTLGMGLYVSSRQGWLQLYALLGFMCAYSGLLISYSRSGWLAFGIVLLMVIIVLILRKELRFYSISLVKLFGIMVLITGVLYNATPHLFQTRLGGGTRLEQKSIEERTNSYSEAASIIKMAPFFGVGMYNYTTQLPSVFGYRVVDGLGRQIIERSSYDYQPVHMVYLLILAELGLYGCIIIMYGLGWIWYSRLKSLIFAHDLPAYYLFAWAAFNGLLVIGLFDHYLWSLHAGLVIFTVIIILNVIPLPNLTKKR